ncbi:hypothetical protein F5Y12DRAFT_641110 [Xylaria sp. FL1777]|nr:hypothetical protein F5Y12DRAFT_641110 [Xylaria sp. FL1777]
MATNPMASNQKWDGQVVSNAMIGPNPAPAPQVTEVYDNMTGFIKSTHWSKPYYSALVHNNPQLPYHLLEHVNCTYLSTPGRAPTLLALKQHAQSLAVLISLLAPAQFGGTLEPPNEGKINGDGPFAAEQAFDWLNNLHEHYDTDDRAHKKPLNALANLVKSNSDTRGPKWHCPLDTTGIEFPEKHPFQQYRPYETHMTLLMHANEILERLDHEYSAMGGILGIIPLDSDNVEEQRALTQAKTTLVGQWILYTQHLVARMHELEIAYGNSLDLLANEAIVPMQHIGIHGPDGRSGRDIVFPQDRWIMANAGDDVFTLIHRMLDRAEAHQNAQDDKFAEQNVLGDAAYSGNDDLKYRGIVKVDLNTRFYRLRSSGHGPLFVLPAFGDRTNTKHTRDMENRPTVVAIPQPDTKEAVNSWESKHKDVDNHMLKLRIDKSNLEAKVSQLQSSVAMRDREIERLNEIHKQYEDKVAKEDKDLAKEAVHLRENIRYFQVLVKEGNEREMALKQEVQNFKDANISVQNDQNPINPLVNKINDQQSQIRDLQKEIKERDKKVEDLARDNDTLRILNSSPLNNSSAASPAQVTQLRAQLAGCQQERQLLLQEIHNLKKAKAVKGKILNFPEGFKFDFGSTFEDTGLGITACSTEHYKALLEAEKERNDYRHEVDNRTLDAHASQAELNTCKAECSRLLKENAGLRATGNVAKPPKIINLPWELKFTSTYRDDTQGLIVLSTGWYDQLIAAEKNASENTRTIKALVKKIATLKEPVEVNLAGASFSSLKGELGNSKVYKDTKSNVAMLTLSYLDELQTADKTRATIQQQLDESQLKVQTLEQHLKDARKQLDDSVKGQNSIDTQLPDLQNERDDLEAQLTKALANRVQLEEQIQSLTLNKPASALESQVLKVQKQLMDSTKNVEEKESELKELQGRYNMLQLNETNLRNEVTSLRQKLSNTQKNAPLTKSSTTQQKGQENEELQVAREELKLYKAELETVQRLWNDLQTQHVNVQTDLESAQKKYDEEKSHLKQKLEESNQSIKVLQMKVLADPNNLQPVIIEMEAQRDTARKNRDQLRENVKKLEQQLAKQKKDCEAEKSALQAKIANLGKK